MERIGPTATSLKVDPQTKEKKEYAKPEVTTFGSVAKLTLGSNGSNVDLLGTRHSHEHHHQPHHH